MLGEADVMVERRLYAAFMVGTSDQDEQCAQAGIDAVKGELT